MSVGASISTRRPGYCKLGACVMVVNVIEGVEPRNDNEKEAAQKLPPSWWKHQERMSSTYAPRGPLGKRAVQRKMSLKDPTAELELTAHALRRRAPPGSF